MLHALATDHGIDPVGVTVRVARAANQMQFIDHREVGFPYRHKTRGGSFAVRDQNNSPTVRFIGLKQFCELPGAIPTGQGREYEAAKVGYRLRFVRGVLVNPRHRLMRPLPRARNGLPAENAPLKYVNRFHDWSGIPGANFRALLLLPIKAQSEFIIRLAMGFGVGFGDQPPAHLGNVERHFDTEANAGIECAGGITHAMRGGKRDVR